MTGNKNSEQCLEELEKYCLDNGLRLTDPRKSTLQVIAGSEKPVGAYDIIEEIGKTTEKPKPTTVYRAIDFLQEHGFIHKIESLNAFVTCHAGHTHEGSQFMVCDDCGTVNEIHLCHLPQALKDQIEGTGFNLNHWNAEIHGRCNSCQK